MAKFFFISQPILSHLHCISVDKNLNEIKKKVNFETGNVVQFSVKEKKKKSLTGAVNP